MATQLDDATIRTALRTSVVSAWSVTDVNYDPPEVPSTSSNLSRALIYLMGATAMPVARGAGFGQMALMHHYRIIGQFPYPSTGTIGQSQVTQVNALLNLIFGSKTYAGWRRYLINVDMQNAIPDQQENVYTVTIDVDFEVITDS